MIVVADTSPLNYLVQLGREAVLRTIYATVVIPPAVLAELRHPGAPGRVREWAYHLPEWMSVSGTVILDPTLPPALGRGESEAISLALELTAAFVLLDDHAGRRAAVQRKLVPAGTVAVLMQASDRGLLEIGDAIQALRHLGFRMSSELEERTRTG